MIRNVPSWNIRWIQTTCSSFTGLKHTVLSLWHITASGLYRGYLWLSFRTPHHHWTEAEEDKNSFSTSILSYAWWDSINIYVNEGAMSP